MNTSLIGLSQTLKVLQSLTNWRKIQDEGESCWILAVEEGEVLWVPWAGLTARKSHLPMGASPRRAVELPTPLCVHRDQPVVWGLLPAVSKHGVQLYIKYKLKSKLGVAAYFQ